jgi:hypothetical protein
LNETKRTLQEKRFIESYIKNNGNVTGAYLAINQKANRNTAGVLGLRMLRKVKLGVNFLLEEMGLNNFYLAGKLKEGLESDDQNLRFRYLDMILKLKGLYLVAGEEEEENRVIINITGEGNAKEKLIEKINKSIKNKEDNQEENN